MKTASILIVEDEAIVGKDLEVQLNKLGYHVNGIVDSGEEALRNVEQERPDLILMDIKLNGGMDGLEAARRLQAKGPIPIVYLTAYPQVFLQNPKEMQEPGLCVAKPLKPSNLHAVLEIALT